MKPALDPPSTSTPPILETDAERLPVPVKEEPHLKMPLPPKGHIYIAIPEDIPKRCITGEAIQGLCRIDSGNLVDELGAALLEVLSAVRTLGRKGKLKLALEIAPGGQNRVAIAFDVTASPPREKRHPFPIFCTTHGQLVSRDPDQMEMDLKTAPPREAGPLRTVPDQGRELRTVA